MILSRIITLNYKSCKEVAIEIKSGKPNILIGMNDCGKTTFLQSLELLLNTKSKINYASDESAKSDLAHTPLDKDEINKKLIDYNLPSLNLEDNCQYIIIAANFKIEEIDHIFTDQNATMQFKWLVHSSINNPSQSLWMVKQFNYTENSSSIFYLTLEGKNEFTNLYDLSQSKINSLVSKYDVTKDIINDNNAGPTSNFEKIRALYLSTDTNYYWSPVLDKTWKIDIEYFPVLRYLDWNQSIESLKNTAKDILANSISHEYESAKKAANKYTEDAQKIVDGELEQLGLHEELKNIKKIRANIFFKVDYQLSDLLVQKHDSENEVHIDSQGEGIKRQLWFAFLKSQAEKSTENSTKRFIWCFDEPETHLHPKAQRDFFNILKVLASKNFQILISTHSTMFVDASSTTEIYSFGKDNNYTNIGSSKEIVDIHESLGVRNSDFLFYNKFLIVEGKTEEALMPELYKVYTGYTLREDNIQLITLDGCGNHALAEDMLQKLMTGFSKISDISIYILDNDVRFSMNKENDEITFLLGRQDLEDSICSDLWHIMSSNLFGDIIDFTKEEIDLLILSIPNNQAVDENHKFAKKYRALIAKKLQEMGRLEEISRLPNKGFEWGKLVASHIKSREYIPQQICLAFDKLKA